MSFKQIYLNAQIISFDTESSVWQEFTLLLFPASTSTNFLCDTSFLICVLLLVFFFVKLFYYNIFIMTIIYVSNSIMYIMHEWNIWNYSINNLLKMNGWLDLFSLINFCYHLLTGIKLSYVDKYIICWILSQKWYVHTTHWT